MENSNYSNYATNCNDTRIDLVFEWLEKAIHTNDEHKFLILHHPIYSTGTFGSHPKLAHRMEKFLDDHQNENIRAVFTGHDHQFSAFSRKNVMMFVNGVGGGSYDGQPDIV